MHRSTKLTGMLDRKDLMCILNSMKPNILLINSGLANRQHIFKIDVHV